MKVSRVALAVALGAALVLGCELIAGLEDRDLVGVDSGIDAPFEAATNPNFSLAISPTRLVVDRGQADEPQKIKIINGGTSEMRVDVTKQNFTGGRDGSMIMAETAPWSASTWVDVSPTTMVIPAGETRVVTARITIPTDPEPGDHQVALVFLVPAGESKANVKINRGIGTPLYVTVPGPIDDSAMVKALDAGGFAAGGPIDITATIENTGTVHRDFRSDTPLRVNAAGTAEPFPDFTVMRGATRDIATTWDPPLMCICHPTVSIIDAKGEVQSMSVRVVVFPLPLLGFILAVLVLAAVAYRLARRRYEHNVIRAAAALRPAVGSGDG